LNQSLVPASFISKMRKLAALQVTRRMLREKLPIASVVSFEPLPNSRQCCNLVPGIQYAMMDYSFVPKHIEYRVFLRMSIVHGR
jgi:hypothetical protein